MTLNFEEQMPIESAKLTSPIKIEKPENPTNMCPHEGELLPCVDHDLTDDI